MVTPFAEQNYNQDFLSEALDSETFSRQFYVPDP